MKLLRDAESRGEQQAKPKRPRAIVLGPTRELTDQILGVAKSISHHAKFRSACVNGGALTARPSPIYQRLYCGDMSNLLASACLRVLVPLHGGWGSRAGVLSHLCHGHSSVGHWRQEAWEIWVH